MERNQFKDAKGRIWTLRITAQKARELKESLDLDIRFVESPEGVEKLLDDSFSMLDAIVLVLMDQLETKGITANDMLCELDGEQFEAACWAFVCGCLFFFPSHKQSPLLALMEKMQTARSHYGSKMTEQVLKTDVTKAVEEATRGALEN